MRIFRISWFVLLCLAFCSACQADKPEKIVRVATASTYNLIAPSGTVMPTATPATSSTLSLPTDIPEIASSQFFVSPDGNPAGDGSQDSPWDLQTAFNHPGQVKPGDTIWLLGGTYPHQYDVYLKGTEGNPITVRQFPGHRAVIDSEGLMLDIRNAWWVDFWGIEITSSQNNRDPLTRPEWGYGVRIHQGSESHHIRFINMIIHDVPAQGFGWWVANTNSEIYGSLIYFNGVNQLDHGIYIKNETGEKVLRDNFIFDNASHGVHAYSSTENTLNNISVIGNTVFNNGSIGFSLRRLDYGISQRNILIGGNVLARSARVIDNYTYFPDSAGQSLNIGYEAGAEDIVVQGNYLVGGNLFLNASEGTVIFANNTIIGSGSSGNLDKNAFSDNLFQNRKPDSVHVFIRQNEFEPNRANITIYNFSKDPQVEITAEELDGLPISTGDRYELRNVQDYFNDVISGVFNGEAISVPMLAHSVAQPVGLDFKPDSTFPEFGAFVLIIQSGIN